MGGAGGRRGEELGDVNGRGSLGGRDAEGKERGRGNGAVGHAERAVHGLRQEADKQEDEEIVQKRPPD
jgi:hypothetical protein